jgi:transcriptional regulator with XRE-family HTH domain
MLDLLHLYIRQKFRTQRRFARAIGKHESWVSRMVCGVYDPTLEERYLICDHLGVEYTEAIFFNREI